MKRGRTVSIDADPSLGDWLCSNAMANQTCSDPTFERAVFGDGYEQLTDCLTAWAVEQAREEPRHRVKRRKDGSVKLCA
jgi:hypothetical protein